MSAPNLGAEAVNWKFIILAIILIGVVINVSGIVFCMADNLIAVGVADAVSILVGLTLVGCMTPENRWRNIILVAAGVWVTDLLPAAIGTISLSFSGWMGSIVWYAILAALSGVISLLITAFINPAAKPAVVAASPPPGEIPPSSRKKLFWVEANQGCGGSIGAGAGGGTTRSSSSPHKTGGVINTRPNSSPSRFAKSDWRKTASHELSGGT